jgi:hypothetical protein
VFIQVVGDHCVYNSRRISQDDMDACSDQIIISINNSMIYSWRQWQVFCVTQNVFAEAQRDEGGGDEN